MILDQFLTFSKFPQTRNKLQLIGLAALLISSKLDEIRPPNLSDLSQICDGLYKENEISKMELEICTCLKWNLTPINLLSWLTFYQERMVDLSPTKYFHEPHSFHCTQLTHGINCTIEYITDFIIHSPDFLNFRPSALSAALISFLSFSNASSFENCTGYEIKDLTEEINFIKSWLKHLGFQDINGYVDYGTLCNLGLRSVVGQIAYCYPKFLPILSNSKFDSLVNFNRKALNFILKQIKQG